MFYLSHVSYLSVFSHVFNPLLPSPANHSSVISLVHPLTLTAQRNPTSDVLCLLSYLTLISYLAPISSTSGNGDTSLGIADRSLVELDIDPTGVNLNLNLDCRPS